jgi:AcrR family transcriptional regulator
MSTSYLDSGRVGQKRRTWQALVDAARQLVADGTPVTVDAAAAHARISRATAYRYFPTKDDLLLAAHPEVTFTSLLPDSPPHDARTRLDLVVTAFTKLILDTEPQQRAMLRASLEQPRPRLPLRRGRGIGWIAEAVEPLEPKLGASGVQRLARAIRSAIGIEALVWLTDIGGLTREEAAATMRWSALSMLEAAVRERPSLPGHSNQSTDES